MRTLRSGWCMSCKLGRPVHHTFRIHLCILARLSPLVANVATMKYAKLHVSTLSLSAEQASAHPIPRSRLESLVLRLLSSQSSNQRIGNGPDVQVELACTPCSDSASVKVIHTDCNPHRCWLSGGPLALQTQICL